MHFPPAAEFPFERDLFEHTEDDILESEKFSALESQLLYPRDDEKNGRHDNEERLNNQQQGQLSPFHHPNRCTIL